MKRLTSVVIAAFLVGGAVAQEIAVDLELVLAIDVSDSMKDEETRIQRQGYSIAFKDPEIVEAIQKGFYKRIAVTAFEFSDELHRRVVVPWTLLENQETSTSFSTEFQRGPNLLYRTTTSISAALLFAVAQFEANGFEGVRKVIDVSGDGYNNSGLSLDLARRKVEENGVIINGLPLMLQPVLQRLDLYYKDCVILGSGSFTVPVNRIDDLKEGIRRKLLLEISGLEPNAQFGFAKDEQKTALIFVNGPEGMQLQDREKMDCNAFNSPG